MIKRWYENIGYVDIIKRKNTFNIGLRIIPFKPLRVTIPHYISLNTVEEFLYKNINLIKNHKARQRINTKKYLVIDENSNVKTKHHQLKINKNKTDKIRINIANGTIDFCYPESMSIGLNHIQLSIREAIDEALRIEAKQYIPKRLHELSQKHQIPYKSIRLKNLRSRWGSCSATNNININVKLMQFPDHLIDYVLLHELAHVKEKNHQTPFRQYLLKICPNAELLEKEFKIYSRQVFR